MTTAWNDFVTCACGKRGYASRKDARRAARMGSKRGVNAYECTHPDAPPIYRWHFGHLPYQVKESRWSRSSLGQAASRRAKG